jgi:transposase
MAMVNAIITLKQRGWSNRRIAWELGIDRETVRRYIADSNPAINAPPGSNRSKPATNAPPGSPIELPAPDAESSNPRFGPDSQCEPLRQVIQNKWEQDLSAQRIYQDLVAEHDFQGSYYSVRRFVRRLGKSRSLPFRRMESPPGDQAQVDFGSGASIVTMEDKRKRSHVFRIVLSHSRKGYSESVYHQTTENFLRTLENAFWSFGGVPKTVVLDNLKAAVHKADWYDPELHPKIQSFCEHYGTVMLPTKPYTPRHKGKIEKGIEYVKQNALKGRRFTSLAQQNEHLLTWEQQIADTRIHGTTRQQVGKVFQEAEKPHLLPLPPDRFASFEEAKRSVQRDAHVEVAKAYYSVPPEYVGREVWARWDGHLVRVFNSRMEQIALHVQVEPGKFQTQPAHIDSRKRSQVEKGTAWLLQRAGMIGPATDRWAQAMLQARGIAGVRVLSGLLHLAQKYSQEKIEKACDIALSHDAFRLRTIRHLIQRGGGKQEQWEFIEEHPIIRRLSEYEEFVNRCLG